MAVDLKFINQTNKNERPAESELSPGQMRAVLDNAVEGIITIDEKGTVLTFNHSAEIMFGYVADEVIGRNISMLMPQPYQAEHDGYLQNYLNTGEKRVIGIGREVSGLRKAGEVFPLALSVADASVSGQISFAGIVRDLSEQKAIEAELKQKENQLAHLDRVNLIGEMAAGIAHEINQPLTAITTYAQACKRLLKSGRADDPAELIKVLDEVSAQVDRAGEVIRRIRAMAKGVQGEREAVNLNDLIHDTMPLVHLNRDSIDKNIQLDLARELAEIEIDMVQIQQVLLNLVRNALDVVDEKGSIIIKSNQQDDTVQVSVKDSGPGIAASAEPHIYHPFFTTKTETSGMGMGLTICQSIINAHGGRLWHENNTDTGATFSFSLPVAVETT